MSGLVLGPGKTVMSKRNVVPAFMACVEDVRARVGETTENKETRKYNNEFILFFSG